MKQPHKLMILSALLSSAALSGCDSENNADSCPFTEAMCQSVNKTLDLETCLCVEITNCDKTEQSCQNDGKMLDIDKCECVEMPSQSCVFTQAMCESAGKTFDEDNCQCVGNPDISPCPADTHVYNKACEYDSLKNCGYHGYSCATAILGWNGGACLNSACVATECIDGFHTYNHTCEPNSLQNCGSHSNTCSTSIEGWKNGTCANGQCKVTECAPCFHLNGNACERDRECLDYRACGTIEHNANGCLDGNVVHCIDGETSLSENCVAKNQFCAPNPESKGGFECKSPDLTDCEWNGALFKKDQTICDGNILRTCSALVNTEFDEGTDCAKLDPTKPICDSNTCRKEKSCGANGEIPPGSLVCNDAGTNKAECIDGQLIELTGDKACTARPNASSVCTFTSSAVCSDVCNAGFTDVNGSCERISQCDANKEKYNASTNKCECDTANHWTGYAGSCTCAPGYVDVNGTCEPGCLYNDVKYTYYQATCNAGKVLTCQNDGTMAESSCTKGVCIEGKCEIRSCDGLNDGETICKSGSLKICNDGTLLEAPTPCAAHQLCLEGASACVNKKTCTSSGTKLDTATNTCVCDTANHWTGYAGYCSCDPGYVQVGSTCEPKKTCDTTKEIYNPATNTCSCNTANHWTGYAGSCKCEIGYYADGNTCIPEDFKHCGGIDCTTKPDFKDGYCKGGLCYVTDCDMGYYVNDNKCIKENLRHCGGIDCTTTPHFKYGFCKGGQCYATDCDMGYYVDNYKCIQEDLKHCGGIDCTTTPYFKDGYCIGGQCQVTDCITGFHVYNDTCEADSVNNCGTHDNACGINQSCSKGTCKSLSNLEAGDTITFGHYEQDNDTTNGKEPITWRVLDKNAAGQYLIISEKALDVQRYHTTVNYITWEKSTIRSWLNGYDASYNTVGTSFTSSNFIDTAFIAEEKAKIVASNVPAHANPSYKTDPGNATTDKIFLLSITEANTYFTSDKDRRAAATPYSSDWWLRSPGNSKKTAAYVTFDGSIYDRGSSVDCSNAVRPALWVNL